MSSLIKWFEKRREVKVVNMIENHLAATVSIVEDLERTLKAAIAQDENAMRRYIANVTKAEKEADMMRRQVMDQLSTGELPPNGRVDLMDLMKRIDMVADWSRESTRILNVLPMQKVPAALQESFLKMMEGSKTCAFALRKCVSKMIEKPSEALNAADEVERQEEKVDEIHENVRRLLVAETKLEVGVAILANELLEALETIADWCEDSCDQVRVIIVRE